MPMPVASYSENFVRPVAIYGIQYLSSLSTNIMCERYEMDDCYPMIAKLKAMGIDVEKMVDDDELKEVTK